MKRLLHPFVIMPLVALLAVGVWWFVIRDDSSTTNASSSTNPAAAMPTSQVADVTLGTMNQTVSAEGTVAAADTDDLSFESSGTVTAVNVKAGDTVTAGQVLATIDSTELAAAVTSAESDVADAKAKLADDQDASASDEQIAADLAKVATAGDTLTNAQTALSGAQLVASFDGTVASVNLTVGEELANGGTGGTTLTGTATGSGQSPTAASSSGSGSGASAFGGSSSSNSSSSSTSTAQIQVVSTGRYEVSVTIGTSDISKIQTGQTVDLTVSTSSASRRTFGGFGGFPGGGALPGASASSGASASGSSGSSGSQSTTGQSSTTNRSGATATGTVTDVSKVATTTSGVAGYTVKVGFDGDATKFFVGTTVTADVVIEKRDNVLQVSSRAITTDDTGSYVEVSKDGTATGATEQRTVTTGLTANGMTEITSGLKEGEKVVITFQNPFANRTAAGQTGTGQTGQLPGAPTGASGATEAQTTRTGS